MLHNVTASAYRVTVAKTLATTLAVVVFMLALAMAFKHLYGGASDSAAESATGNVGGQSRDRVAAHQPSEKQQLCYSDGDCPKETRCSPEGVCVPVLHDLPPSRHIGEQYGRGREGEKPT